MQKKGLRDISVGYRSWLSNKCRAIKTDISIVPDNNTLTGFFILTLDLYAFFFLSRPERSFFCTYTQTQNIISLRSSISKKNIILVILESFHCLPSCKLQYLFQSHWTHLAWKNQSLNKTVRKTST